MESESSRKEWAGMSGYPISELTFEEIDRVS